MNKKYIKYSILDLPSFDRATEKQDLERWLSQAYANGLKFVGMYNRIQAIFEVHEDRHKEGSVPTYE